MLLPLFRVGLTLPLPLHSPNSYLTFIKLKIGMMFEATPIVNHVVCLHTQIPSQRLEYSLMACL